MAKVLRLSQNREELVEVSDKSRHDVVGAHRMAFPAFKTALVDDNGTKFAYIDSGAPAASTTYATLVCVHGHTYHARTTTFDFFYAGVAHSTPQKTLLACCRSPHSMTCVSSRSTVAITLARRRFPKRTLTH